MAKIEENRSDREKLTLTPQRLVLITGVGGSGKSSLIDGLRDKDGAIIHEGLRDFVHACLIDKDEIGDRITKSRAEDYQRTVRKGVYEVVFDETRQFLERGDTVIVNASFSKEIGDDKWYRPYEDLALKHNAVLKIIRVIAPVDLIHQRVVERGSPYDAHKDLGSPQEFASWLESNENIEVPMPPGSLVVQNRDFPHLVSQVLNFIAAE